MGESSLLADRLAWARREQGLTLHQLSARSGRAVSYLSQLEHGHRVNPTTQTVEVLAEALGVRPAFLLGDRQEMPAATPFRQYVEQLSLQAREKLTYATPDERFCALVTFLIEHSPDRFTPVEVAFQLGMSMGQYRAIMQEGAEVSHFYLEQLASISGVPLTFLTLGTFEAPRRSLQELDDAALRYMAAIRMAMEQGLTPERLTELILTAGAR